MKQNYFDQGRADDDDHILKMAIKRSLVPPNCLLSGYGVMSSVDAGRDPCAACPGPRMACGGRNFGGSKPTIPIAKHYQAERGRNQFFFFLGVDSAPSESQRSDDGALVAAVAQPKHIPAPDGNNPRALSPLPADWYFDFVFAQRLTAKEKASARQYAGVIHRLHNAFNFDGIMIDPGGGGIWVKRELENTKQLINGIETNVIPIADKVEGPFTHIQGQFILNLYKRGDPGIELLWPKLAGDDQLNDAAYSVFKDGFDKGMIGMPEKISIWRSEFKHIFTTWSIDRQWCAINLDALVNQLLAICVLMDEDGERQKLTARGARKFEAHGKKDLASAAMYCYLEFLQWLRGENFTVDIKPQDKPKFSAW